MHINLSDSRRLSLGGVRDVTTYTREVCPWMLKF